VTDRDAVDRYHDGTKHHFDRFARSLGYLDWASQPNPFRSFDGADAVPLSPRPGAPATAVGDVLRYSLGLSAWKQFRESRWALRVNPSSGNLHPTEAYAVLPEGVFHYAPDRHALESRCRCQTPVGDGEFLVALTSIHWREAWKYGERAFRYCQHDLGHAIAAIAIAAANAGLEARLLTGWSHDDIAAMTGVDRTEDFGAEREEAGCVIAVGSRSRSQQAVAQAVWPAGLWTGRANQLSADHVDWPIIDEIARATRVCSPFDGLRVSGSVATARGELVEPRGEPARAVALSSSKGERYPRSLILQRRSAVALDGRSSIDRDRFLAILTQTMPGDMTPWSAVPWDARIHLALFVHRVDGLDPGLYLLVRNVDAIDRLHDAMQRDFLWRPVTTDIPLFCLARGDARALAQRLSCDQAIAADGFFSLGMIADFDASLSEFGAPFYRRLFWESGVVGQVLYLEAERAGTRGTGIGCFYDDPVHEVLGLTDHRFQSLYHFTIGMPIEDTRLTTEPGYDWESRMSTDTP
jgi:SagB-type dehydrogenase family enzyme